MKWKKRLRQIQLLKQEHRGTRYAVPFPDLSVEQGAPSLSDGFAPIRGRRELPADAKQYPVGCSHKSGLQLVTPNQLKNELPWLGGKKP